MVKVTRHKHLRKHKKNHRTRKRNIRRRVKKTQRKIKRRGRRTRRRRQRGGAEAVEDKIVGNSYVMEDGTMVASPMLAKTTSKSNMASKSDMSKSNMDNILGESYVMEDGTMAAENAMIKIDENRIQTIRKVLGSQTAEEFDRTLNNMCDIGPMKIKYPSSHAFSKEIVPIIERLGNTYHSGTCKGLNYTNETLGEMGKGTLGDVAFSNSKGKDYGKGAYPTIETPITKPYRSTPSGGPKPIEKIPLGPLTFDTDGYLNKK